MPQPIVVENFVTNTGQFTVIGAGSVGPGSFTFAGGQGTFTDSSGINDATMAYDTNMPVSPGPAIFVYGVVGTPAIPVPPASAYSNLCAGIFKDALNQVSVEFGPTPDGIATHYNADILLFVAGTQYNLGTLSSAVITATPEAVGFSLQGNIVTCLVRFSGVWQVMTSADVSAHIDFTAPGAVSGYYAGAGITTDTPTTIAINELWSGPPIITTVPNVVGESFTAASSDIVAAGLIVGTFTPVASASPPGTVLTQSPASGTVVLTGSSVTGTQSQGVLVPDLTNTSISVVAPALLAAADLVVGTITYHASGTVIAGNVISQVPVAGSFATAGSGVNVVVSSGLPSLRVPDLFEMSQSDAVTLLLSLGLTVGAIGSAPSKLIPPGVIQTQNPSAGTPVAAGSVVSFVLSLGTLAVGTAFDFEATVISQYANSPTILQLVNNLNEYIDQSANFANFFNFVWNVDTAVGFGLDIWGKIVGVSRLLNIPNTTDYVGFDNGTRSPPDWQTMGSDQPPQPAVGGAMYTGYNATTAYLLPDNAYRQLILAKAFANIAATTAPAINQILQNLYGPGTAWVLNTGPMAISYNLNFHPTAIQLAILEQSGVIPTPPGVSVTVIAP